MTLDKTIYRNYKYIFFQTGYSGNDIMYIPEIRKIKLEYFVPGTKVSFLGAVLATISEALGIDITNVDDKRISFNQTQPGLTFSIRHIWLSNI